MNFKTMQFFEPGDFLDLFANDMDPLPAKSFLFNLDYSKLSKHQASDRAFDLYRTFRKSPEAMDFYRRGATRPYSYSWALPSMELSHLILARIAETGHNPARVPAAIFEEAFFECPYRFLFFEPDFAQVDVEEIRAYVHFLEREGMPTTEACLALLNDEAAERLLARHEEIDPSDLLVPIRLPSNPIRQNADQRRKKIRFQNRRAKKCRTKNRRN